jgi:DNA invertase Pin-like site-specific DNA recombinase
MLYAYIRVSTDTQSVENQRFVIEEYCKENSLVVNGWINEVISGKIDIRERELGKLMDSMKKGDVLICSEISRLGRDMLMLMSVLNECVNKEVKIIAIKGNYRLENNLTSKIFAMAYGISSELEREFIVQRTKDALSRKRIEGIILGRPKGAKSKNRKLLEKENEVRLLLKNKTSFAKIARYYSVDRSTVRRFAERIGWEKPIKT